MGAVFALDSIPTILSLTQTLLVVYSSNIFAILGIE
jgi:predicted tellurium resistance membrane protein TerC